MHKRDDVALIADVVGNCGKCKHHGIARLVAYYSGEIVIRCNHCKTAGQFTPDDKGWTDPSRFAPFRGDRDDPEEK